MCNRCGCGCGCGNNNRSWNDYDNYNFNTQERFDDAAWREAERIIRERNRRRCHEDRCAREFVRCIRCRNWNY